MSRFRSRATILSAVIFSSCAGVADAQTARPAAAFEVNTGLATFTDEDPVEHFSIGAAPRFYVSPRVSVGPEFVYMIGPGEDREFFLTGNVWFDFVEPPASGVNRVTPYLVGGVGVMLHRDFLHNEGVKWFHKEVGFSGGFGVRVAVTERWYLAPEVRLGSELHARLTGAVGFRMKR